MPSGSYTPNSVASGKAQAKADKAYRKAMRPWYTKKRFIIPLLLIALIALIALLSGGDSSGDTNAGTSTPGNSASPAGEAPAAGIGDEVSDGDFAFTVTGVEEGGATLGDVLPTEAQGTFVVVRADVTNNGNEAGMFGDTAQKAYDEQGREFSAESVPGMEGWDKAFVNQINPGNTVSGAPLVFDVPEGTTLTKIKLHGSMFSEGTEVALTE